MDREPGTPELHPTDESHSHAQHHGHQWRAEHDHSHKHHEPGHKHHHPNHIPAATESDPTAAVAGEPPNSFVVVGSRSTDEIPSMSLVGSVGADPMMSSVGSAGSDSCGFIEVSRAEASSPATSSDSFVVVAEGGEMKQTTSKHKA